jgi:outer membrane protein assembly factor BamB
VADLSGDGKKEVLVWMLNGSAGEDMATQWRQSILYCLNGTTGSEIWHYIILGCLDLPVVADLFGNGKLEVIVGSCGFHLLDPKYTSVPASVTCLNGTTGDKIWNYTTGLDESFSSSPVVADLFGDGKKEVLAVSYNGVYCLNGTTGSEIWNYATGCGYSSPVVADLSGNGKLEVLVAAFWNSIYCLNGTTGDELWNSATGYNDHSPTVADLFGDGKPEVLVGSRDGGAYCFDGITGSRLWNFIAERDTVEGRRDISASPLAADLFGNGKQEVLVGSYDYGVYCLDGATGSRVWNYTTGEMIQSSPVVADLLGNGRLEVLVGSGDYNVYCFDGATGNKLWNSTIDYVYSSPIVVEISAGGTLVIGGAGSSVYCLNGTTGNMLWTYPTDGSVVSSPVVADIFGNGEKEILIGALGRPTLGASGRSPAASPPESGAIYCIVLPEGTLPTTLPNELVIGLAILGIGGPAVAVATFAKLRKSKKGL